MKQDKKIYDIARFMLDFKIDKKFFIVENGKYLEDKEIVKIILKDVYDASDKIIYAEMINLYFINEDTMKLFIEIDTDRLSHKFLTIINTVKDLSYVAYADEGFSNISFYMILSLCNTLGIDTYESFTTRSIIKSNTLNYRVLTYRNIYDYDIVYKQDAIIDFNSTNIRPDDNKMLFMMFYEKFREIIEERIKLREEADNEGIKNQIFVKSLFIS